MIDQTRLNLLLKEMYLAEDGRIERTMFSGSKERAIDRHHIDILEDAGLAEWIYASDGKKNYARITLDGYRIFEQITLVEEEPDKAGELVRKAVKLYQEAKTVVQISSSLHGIIQAIGGG